MSTIIINTEIRAFPSKYFYQDKLLDAPEISNIYNSDYENKRQFLKACELGSVTFYDIDSRETRVNKSFSNTIELKFAMNIIKKIYNKLLEKFEEELKKSDFSNFKNKYMGKIAIITPYRSQVQDFISAMRELPIEIGSSIEINTVDGFQGREKDIVIFSCVRSGHETFHSNNNQIGFLNDARRLNVAITRAKSCLIVIGNSKALYQDKVWSSYINSNKVSGSYQYS